MLFLEKAFIPKGMSKQKLSNADEALVSTYLSRIAKTKLLTRDEEQELGRRIQQGGKDADVARNQLVNANLKFVIMFARQFIKTERMPMIDLIQEGTIGMMRAAEKFDPSLGFRFSTYAAWWIKRAMIRASGSQGKMVRLPPHRMVELHQAVLMNRHLTQKLQREPTMLEWAAAMNMKVEKLESLLPYLTEVESLDQTITEDGGTTIGDMMEDKTAEEPFQALELASSAELLSDFMHKLHPREEKVIRLRTGFLEHRSYSLDEIADRFFLSRERIRQIERKAIERLKKYKFEITGR